MAKRKSRGVRNDLLKRNPHGGLSRDEIIRAIRAAGVDGVPKLADQLLAIYELSNPRTHGGAVFAGSALAKLEAKSTGLKIVHQPPKVPLYIDGVAVKPTEISKFNGRPLHFAVTVPGRKGEIVLQAFTGTDYLTFLKGNYVSSMQFICPNGENCGGFGPQPPNPFPYTNFWEVVMWWDIDFENIWLPLPSGYAFPDLTQVAGQLFPFQNWNDQISSMHGTNTHVTYFWDINFGGSSLTIPPYTPIWDLRTLGWNDVISSVINWTY